MHDILFPELNPRTLVPSLDPTLVVDGAGLEKAAKYLSKVNIYALDYETDMQDRFFHRRARTIQFGDKDQQFVIDLLAFAETPERLYNAQGLHRQYNAAPELYRSQEGAIPCDYGASQKCYHLLDPVVNVVRPSLESNSHLKIGHNLEFEYIVSSWCLGMRIWNFYCTMVAERILTNGLVNANSRGHFGLADVLRKYLRVEINKDLQQSFDLSTPLTEEQITYCALDCRLPFAVKDRQEVLIREGGLERCIQIEMNAIPAFGDLHLNGMLVDKASWQKIIEENEAALELAIAKMDSFFLPIVGKKEKWDDALIARLQSEWEALKVKSADEVAISELIRKSKKDHDLYAQLLKDRARMEDRRKEATAVAKAAYTAEKSKANKKARDDYGKMEGDAAINYNSPAQLLEALLEGKFGFNKTNLRSTGDDSLTKYAEVPVIAAIVNYRKYKKKLGTYGDRWIKTRDQKSGDKSKYGYVDPDTGRIHAKFMQLGTDTGRPSCVSPNLLNVERNATVRGAFISRPGYDMVTKDCAGQELRILTEYSHEPSWVEAFKNDQDLHSISAEMLDREVWHKAALRQDTRHVKEDGKVEILPPCAYFFNDKMKCKCPAHDAARTRLKAVNFSVVNDMQAYSLSLDLGITKDAAQHLLNTWHKTFATTSKTLKNLRDGAYDAGEARTLSGRRRLARQVTYDQATEKAKEKAKEKDIACDQKLIMVTYQAMIAAVKRALGNCFIQGSAADMLKLAMGCGFDPDGKPYLWHILQPKYGAFMLNYVYDEFVTESPEQHSKAVEAEVEDAILRSGAEFVTVVPMKSEGAIAKRWKK